MNKFEKDNEIECVLNLIEQDSSLLSKLDLEELEEYFSKQSQL